MTLQDIIDERKVVYENCLRLVKDKIAYEVRPSLEHQLEAIRLLESLRDRENEKITVAYLTTNIMKDEDVDRLEKRLSEKFGNKVVCIPPTIKNITFFDPESLIEQKFDIRKGDKENT